ncbi:MAG TPA: dTDP-glucose 4,6-dehydratase [Candidatus Angelobacter sp.]|nr:dTDP-glucose 4,6-dehydratase [Candidatus Angelobacter sp.]
MKPILVTGGAGFIGSNFVRHWLNMEPSPVVNLDKLTYAGNLASLSSIAQDSRHSFVRGDICDERLVGELLHAHRPWAIIHFAAESHVDRSIHNGQDFIRTNVEGTFCLLQAAREYLNHLSSEERSAFRFVHISTDEVYGSLRPDAPAFTESTPYAPNSPYSASKAAADHLVRAFHHTYVLPTITTNCSNNYGPCQFPEKLIPLMIHNALNGKSLPVYGDGSNVRDWLYVLDHCEAIRQVVHKGALGETYNIGGQCEKNNLEVVKEVCAILSELRPGPNYASLIRFVEDRPGHDLRYAVDISKVRREIGWTPKESFSSGLRKTICWFLENSSWVESVTSGSYREWIDIHYEAGRQRIGQ